MCSTHLLVEALNETDEGPPDLHGLRVGRLALGELVNLLVANVLKDEVLGIALKEKVEELGELKPGVGPVLEGHVRVRRGAEVEPGREKGEKDSKLLVRRDRGLEERREDRDLLATVGVLRRDEAM